VTVVIPEKLSSYSMFQFLRRRSTFWLKASLLFETDVVVTNVPLLPEGRTLVSSQTERPLEPLQNVALIPVSGVHAATARAVSYSTSLRPASVEALFFATDPEEQERITREWIDWSMGIDLSVVDAPFRDFTEPMLREVRRHTARDGTIVTVVLPEFVVHRWWEHMLHNQTAFFLKRLLLFEPKVVVTSVPFHLNGQKRDRASRGSARRGE
jgi:hypothetical protein